MMKENSMNTLVSAIKNGALVVYPTDTLYALGASVFHHDAVKQVFSLKHRPCDVPLPIAVSSMDQLSDLVDVNSLGMVLADHFFPGPLTLIMKNRSIPSVVTGGKDTVAVRIPDDEKALALLTKTGPLTVTSANIHGIPSPSTIKEIRNMFKSEHIALFIDDGIRAGKPSTIVDIHSGQPVILRKGEIPRKKIEAVVSKNNG